MGLSDLLRQIRERPDDDAPRLAFADAVEKDDPERAEFIRAQIRLHTMPTMHPEWAALDRRAEALWRSTNGDRWRADRPHGPSVEWYFERGFADIVQFNSHAAFTKHVGAAFAAATPRVVLSGWREVAKLATSPGLALVRDLELGGQTEQLLAILASPHLARLTRLDFALWPDDAVLAAVARLSGLRHLRLRGFLRPERGFGPDALRSLAALSGLESLCLDECRLDDDGARALLEALPPVTRLELTDNHLAGGAAEAIASSAPPSLRELSLRKNRIGARGAEALAGAARLRSLVGLDLSDNLIDDPGMLALGRTRELPALRYLAAGGNPARPALIDAVTERFRVGGPPLGEPPPAEARRGAGPPGEADEDGLVRAIVADPDDLTARLVYADWLEEHGAAALAGLLRGGPDPGRETEVAKAIQAGYPRQVTGFRFDAGLPVVAMNTRGVRTKAFVAGGAAWLRRHHVHGLRLQPYAADWAAVAGVAALGELRALDLSQCRMTPADVEAFFGAARLPRLCALDVGYNALGVEGIRAVVESDAAGGLVRLGLRNVQAYERGVVVVAGAERLAGLAALDLRDNWLGDESVEALATSPHLGGLRELDLRGNRMSPRVVRVLVETGLLARLRRLAIDFSPAADGPAALARAMPPAARLVMPASDMPPAVRAEVDGILGDRIEWA